MKRRLIEGLALWAAALALLTFLAATPVGAESYTPESYFTFDAATGTITGYDPAGGNDVSIPPAIGGVPVTAVGAHAFELLDTITSVVIPEGVTSIEDYAFSECYSLASVTLPDSLTSIGNWAFSCANFYYGITLPDNLTSLGEGAFCGCYNLRSITIPAGITEIADYTFDGTEPLGLGNVTFLGDITRIGDYAFRGCHLSSGITLPESLTSIGEGAFLGAGGLSSATIPDAVYDIGNKAFQGCWNLQSVTLPDGLSGIGNDFFSGCTSLHSITLPDSVTSIGSGAFYGSGLEGITLPDGVTSIGEGAFWGCGSLEEISIPSGVTSIGNNLFNGCTFLSDITLPSGITSIGEGTFASCPSLCNLTIPDSVTTIGALAFYGSGLHSLTIPAGVTSIGDAAFYQCTGLNAVYYLGDAPAIGNVYPFGFFEGTPGSCKVYYPYDASGWSNPWQDREAIARCTVTFDSRGGSDVASAAVNIGSPVSGPAAPTRENATFAGWYREASLENPWDFDSAVTENITLYAKWNMLPARKTGIPAASTAGVTLGAAYTLYLTAIFEDADADPLTYKVSVNGAGDIGANADYSYTPASAGDTTLVFKADDGTADSTDTYTVTLTAGPATHVVEVSADPAAGGSVTGGGSYPEGTSVTVTATPNSGYAFVNWAEGGSPVSAGAAYTFTLGASGRTLVAGFMAMPPAANTGTIAGTVSDGANPVPGANVSLTVSGSVYSATTAANGGYSIANVPPGTGYTVTAAKTGYRTAAVDNVTVASGSTATVNFTLTVRSGGGGGGGNSGSNSPATPTYNASISGIGAAKSTLPVDIDTNAGNATTDLGALAKDIFAVTETAVIAVPSITGVNAYTLGIPAATLSGSRGEGALTYSTGVGSLTIPANMLAGIPGTEGSSAGITISQADRSGLPDEVQTAIGGRPVIQVTLTLNDTRVEWNNPDAPVTIAIPYEPTATELANPESIVIWYIDGGGNAVCVPGGRYDPATGRVTFTTTHFSCYAVGYNKVGFNDVAADAWYGKAVGFIAARGITTGTGGGNFGPRAKLTRGQFLVMLMKAYGMEPDANPQDNFSDAGSAYYTGYLAAAKRQGVTGGVGNNMFAPDQEITRQEMFTLLYNALKVIGKLPAGNAGKPLSGFGDAGQIAAWSKDAMTLLVRAGVVGGSDGRLDPAGSTTRAEMAQVLYNLLAR